jgi:hypothetical protein
MKLRDGGPRGTDADRARTAKQRSSANVTLTPLSAEWMDPLSWRLPSGKRLAEFALQSGFLAPLLMGGPLGNGRIKPPKPVAKKAPAEVPVSTGNFRDAGLRQVRNGAGRGAAGEWA